MKSYMKPLQRWFAKINDPFIIYKLNVTAQHFFYRNTVCWCTTGMWTWPVISLVMSGLLSPLNSR